MDICRERVDISYTILYLCMAMVLYMHVGRDYLIYYFYFLQDLVYRSDRNLVDQKQDGTAGGVDWEAEDFERRLGSKR